MSMTFWYWIFHMTGRDPSNSWLRHSTTPLIPLIYGVRLHDRLCEQEKTKQNQGRTWLALALAAHGAGHTSPEWKLFLLFELTRCFKFFKGAILQVWGFVLLHRCQFWRQCTQGSPSHYNVFATDISQWCCRICSHIVCDSNENWPNILLNHLLSLFQSWDCVEKPHILSLHINFYRVLAIFFYHIYLHAPVSV